jgi:hypothetical protein
MLPGKLIIRPIGANYLRSVTKSGKMSPFIKVCAGTHCGQSAAVKKALSAFSWDLIPKNEVVLPCHDNEIITIECWHKKKLIGKDKLIGKGVFTLEASAFPSATVKSVPLTFEGLDAGSINLEISFFPDKLTHHIGSHGIGSTSTTTWGTTHLVENPLIGKQAGMSSMSNPIQNTGFVEKPVYVEQTGMSSMSNPIQNTGFVENTGMSSMSNPTQQTVLVEKPIIVEKVLEKPMRIEERTYVQPITGFTKTVTDQYNA